jgi:hypothetical protein
MVRLSSFAQYSKRTQDGAQPIGNLTPQVLIIHKTTTSFVPKLVGVFLAALCFWARTYRAALNRVRCELNRRIRR